MTGVSAPTLRAWERRYGVPVPSRTDSAYRVYSEADVAMIRRVRELCESGISAAEAARLASEEAEEHTSSPASVEAEDPFETLRQQIIDAVDRFEPETLARKLEQAATLAQPSIVIERVFRGALIEIGERWEDGSMSVAQEHLATDAILGVVQRLIPLIQPGPGARNALLACFEDDEHGFAVHALSVHLSSWGWQTVVLGARTPPSAVGHAVRELSPAVVGLSTTVAPRGHRARELVDGYAAACAGVPWVVGGAGVEAIAKLVVARGGLVLDEPDPKTIRTLFESIIARPRSNRRV